MDDKEKEKVKEKIMKMNKEERTEKLRKNMMKAKIRINGMEREVLVIPPLPTVV